MFVHKNTQKLALILARYSKNLCSTQRYIFFFLLEIFRVQATSQTGEDDLDEELQTEPIHTLEKWTQNPPPPLTSLPDPNDQDAVIQALHGVGGQMENHDISQKTMKAVDSIRLSKFLESASQALITLLEEDEERRYGSSKEAQEQKDVVFSDRVTLLGK